MTSPDGITWTSRTSAADNGWSSVTYGNGLFDAVSINGTGNRVMTSVGQSITATCGPAVVDILPPAPTCTLKASPVTLTDGGSLALTYNITNTATSASIDNGAPAVTDLSPGDHMLSVVPALGQTVYTMTVSNTGGQNTCIATGPSGEPLSEGVTVNPPAPTCTFTPATQEVAPSGNITFYYRVYGTATAASVNGFAVPIPPDYTTSGTTYTYSVVAPATSGSYNYQLTVSNAGGQNTCGATGGGSGPAVVTVQDTTPPPPTISSFSAQSVSVESYRVQKNTAATLQWNIANMTDDTICTVNKDTQGSALPSTGMIANSAWQAAGRPAQWVSSTETWPLTSETNFTLSCTNAGGTAKQSIRVLLVPSYFEQ